MKTIILKIKTLVIGLSLISVVGRAQCPSSFSYTLGPTGTATFAGSPASTATNGFKWNFGNGVTSPSNMGPSNQTITYASDGIYVVTATHTVLNSCSNTTSQTITINSAGCNLNASLVAFIMGSPGLVYINNASGNWCSTTTYTLNFGDGSSALTSYPTQAQHTYTSNGTYSVTLTASNGGTCSSSQSTVLTIYNTPCTANSSFNMSPTGTAQIWNAIPAFTGSYSAVQWNWGDGSTSNALFTSHTYSAAGTYSICLTLTAYCGATSTSCYNYAIYRPAGASENMDMVTVNVVHPSTVTGIVSALPDNLLLSITPNPNNGQFRLNVKGLENKNTTMVIYNLVGERIYHSHLETVNGAVVKDLYLDKVSNGVYFIMINNGSKSFTKKIVVNQ
ncbi:MAG: PKD domain-containing protein [Bacteroidota bacterium]